MNQLLLEPKIQHYAWGDRFFIPGFLGLEPDGKPWAELWLGTHSKGMSRIGTKFKDVNLIDFLQSDPAGTLGKASVNRFGNDLPFLYKILAVEQPLSIQCHPTIQQAVDGFNAEEYAGIPIDAATRNYKDKNHKPEIVFALTPYTAMCGFRPALEIVEGLQCIIPESYAEYFSNILNPSEKLDDSFRIRGFFHKIMTLESFEVKKILEEIDQSVSRYSEKANEYPVSDSLIDALKLTAKFKTYYPQDPGILAPFYLNIIHLSPGEALFQPAGELHAYVEGVGVELMANSDNVLRGGLTPKHIDVDQLLHIVHFVGEKKEKVSCVKDVYGRNVFVTPTDEFQLSIITDSEITVHSRESVEMLLCTEGRFSIDLQYGDGVERFVCTRGQSMLVPAAVASYTITVEGQVCTAGIPGTGASL